MTQNLNKAVTGKYLGNTPDGRHLLQEMYNECHRENWDGYSALPISPAALLEAGRFLDALPLEFPTPEMVPEPCGAIGFEWNQGKDRIFVVSVDGTNRITYAGLLGPGNKAHGTAVFDGSIPKTVIGHISRL